MNGASLNKRLIEPTSSTDFFGLLDNWRQDIIELRLVGMASFYDTPSLLNKVRGALGKVLLSSGSLAVRQRRPCDWSRCCAAEVFFAKKPQIQIGPYFSEITKPYVLNAGKKGMDLIIRIRIFGFAREWTNEIAPALIQALLLHVHWRKLAGRSVRYIPAKLEVLTPRVTFAAPITRPQPPDLVRLVFTTPLDAERGTLEGKPHLVFERLAGRIIMLARWHDIEISVPWQELEQAWLRCDYQLESGSVGSAVRLGGHRFKNSVIADQTISIEGDLKQLWPLLIIGETTNVGRGASIGLGQYVLFSQ